MRPVYCAAHEKKLFLKNMIYQMTIGSIMYSPRECKDVKTYIHHVLTETFTEEENTHADALKSLFNKYLFCSADGRHSADESSHIVYAPVEKMLKNVDVFRGMHLHGVCAFLENMHGYSEKGYLNFNYRLKLSACGIHIRSL